MKLFRRRTKVQLPTEEDVAERKKRETEIEAEVERGDFEKAYELAAKCAEDYKGKDPFGEAYCCYLVGHSLVRQHIENEHKRLKDTSVTDYEMPKMPLADYNKAKRHLKRSLEIYELFARNKEYERNRRLRSAAVLIDISLLESFVGRWNEALEACRRSFEICRKYRDQEGMQNATQLVFNLRAKKLGVDIFQLAGTLLSSGKKD